MVKNCQVLDNSSRLNSGRQFILAPYRLPTPLVIKIGRPWNSASPSVCERSETGANGAKLEKGILNCPPWVWPESIRDQSKSLTMVFESGL